jgi:Predicted integral membrane protein (DUF2269)
MVNELTVLTSIHVLAAAVWVGGALVLNIAMPLAVRSGEPPMMLAGMRLANFVGPRVLVPSGLIVLLTGVWLTEDYYDWDLLWIQLGLIGAITVLAVALAYVVPKGRRGLAGIEAGQPPPPGRNWVPILSPIMLVLLIAVLVLMVIKPT